MQNLSNEAGRDAPARISLPLTALAQPRIVLLAAGLLGLTIDLFVRPLSWVGFALIGLATAPWMLQAWSQRSVPAATASKAPRAATGAAEIPARAGHRIASAGQSGGQAKPPAASTAVREAQRQTAPTDPAVRPPTRPVNVPEPDPRTVAPRPLPARTASPRSPEAPAPTRPVRPETAR